MNDHISFTTESLILFFSNSRRLLNEKNIYVVLIPHLLNREFRETEWPEDQANMIFIMERIKAQIPDNDSGMRSDKSLTSKILFQAIIILSVSINKPQSPSAPCLRLLSISLLLFCHYKQ